MNWLLTVVLCVLLVELALRLPFAADVEGLRRAGSRAVRLVMAKAVSDHWKEKAMGAYAQATFISSMKIAGLLAAVLAVAAGLVWAFEKGFNGFQSFILGWHGLGFSIVVASIYLLARRVITLDRL